MSATTESESTDSTKKSDERLDIGAMKKAMMDTKVEGTDKNAWQMTLETFGMADGKSKKGDIIVDSAEDGLKLLNEYVNARQKKIESSGATGSSTPLMDLTPIKEFNATQDQFLSAFLKWSEKDDKKKEGDGNTKKYNVSKAHRRLDTYFEWMSENRNDMEEPLTVESIQAASKVWEIQMSYDEQGRFLWWIDLGSLDKASIKKISNRDHLRYVVWFSHFVMLDQRAQDNGVMMIEDMGMMGFWKMMTLVPTDLGAKLDRLTIGILPIKMKAIYVFGAARWISLLIAFIKPFMSKKMRERMIIVPKKTDMQKFCDDMVLRKNIPKDFSGIQGEFERDLIFQSFKKE